MKDYNTIPEQLNAISWQLKRIADALEQMNETKQNTQPKRILSQDSIKLKDFLNSLDK